MSSVAAPPLAPRSTARSACTSRELHIYLITYNMDDITYGPLKCSQEMVMSYELLVRRPGTARPVVAVRNRRRRLQLRPRRRRGRRPDDGGDVARDTAPSWWASCSDSSSPRRWYKVLSRCCRTGQAPWTAAETSNRLREPLAGRVGPRGAAPPRAGGFRAQAPGRRPDRAGRAHGLRGGPRGRRPRHHGVAGLPKFSMEAPAAKTLPRRASNSCSRYASMLAPKAAFLRAPPRQEGKPVKR